MVGGLSKSCLNSPASKTGLPLKPWNQHQQKGTRALLLEGMLPSLLVSFMMVHAYSKSEGENVFDVCEEKHKVGGGVAVGALAL